MDPAERRWRFAAGSSRSAASDPAAGCVFSPAEDGGVRRAVATPVGHTAVPNVGTRINRTVSSSSDALSGDPTRAAMASSVAGMVQASLLLPMNTVQTQMQTRGMSSREVVRLLFRNGPVSGLTNLYRAIAPTVGMLGARQGLKFGAGAAFKRRLPPTWPEHAQHVDGAVPAATARCPGLPGRTLLFCGPRSPSQHAHAEREPRPEPQPQPEPEREPEPEPDQVCA